MKRSSVPGVVMPPRLTCKLHLACDACRSKKIKCDGKTPCSHCLSRGLTCVYSLQRKAGPRPREFKNEKIAKVVAAACSQARDQDGDDSDQERHPLLINNCCLKVGRPDHTADALIKAEDFSTSADSTGTESNMGTPTAFVPVREMFEPQERAFKTEPSSKPQEMAIAHLVHDTLEPGIFGQDVILATHPNDMIGDNLDDYWPGMGNLSDPFDSF